MTTFFQKILLHIMIAATCFNLNVFAGQSAEPSLQLKWIRETFPTGWINDTKNVYKNESALQELKNMEPASKEVMEAKIQVLHTALEASEPILLRKAIKIIISEFEFVPDAYRVLILKNLNIANLDFFELAKLTYALRTLKTGNHEVLALKIGLLGQISEGSFSLVGKFASGGLCSIAGCRTLDHQDQLKLVNTIAEFNWNQNSISVLPLFEWSHLYNGINALRDLLAVDRDIQKIRIETILAALSSEIYVVGRHAARALKSVTPELPDSFSQNLFLERLEIKSIYNDPVGLKDLIDAVAGIDAKTLEVRKMQIDRLNKIGRESAYAHLSNRANTAATRLRDKRISRETVSVCAQFYAR